MKRVALFTRAWIEIIVLLYVVVSVKSPSSRGRGLKYITIIQLSHRYGSRPLHEGVDWNSARCYIFVVICKSPSSRGRGLKYNLGFEMSFLLPSPSSRGRGLKSSTADTTVPSAMVALFTRAWIEISCFCVDYRVCCVALFTRAWIEIILNEDMWYW